MKAIFGKLSVACSVTSVILCTVGVGGTVWAMIRTFHAMVEGSGAESGVDMATMAEGISKAMHMMPLALFGVLLIPFVFVFCYMSARKRETPKAYRYIGFFLTCAWFLGLFVLGPLLLGFAKSLRG